jgi:hypothetical protein
MSFSLQQKGRLRQRLLVAGLHRLQRGAFPPTRSWTRARCRTAARGVSGGDSWARRRQRPAHHQPDAEGSLRRCQPNPDEHVYEETSHATYSSSRRNPSWTAFQPAYDDEAEGEELPPLRGRQLRQWALRPDQLRLRAVRPRQRRLRGERHGEHHVGPGEYTVTRRPRRTTPSGRSGYPTRPASQLPGGA